MPRRIIIGAASGAVVCYAFATTAGFHTELSSLLVSSWHCSLGALAMPVYAAADARFDARRPARRRSLPVDFVAGQLVGDASRAGGQMTARYFFAVAA